MIAQPFALGCKPSGKNSRTSERCPSKHLNLYARSMDMLYGHPHDSRYSSIRDFLTETRRGDSVRIATLPKLAFLAVLALFLLPSSRAQNAGQTEPAAAAPVWRINCPGVPNVPMTSDAEQSLPLQVSATLKCGEEVTVLPNAEGYTANANNTA